MSFSLITPALAQAAGDASSGGSTMMSLLPFVAVFVIMYFILIRPQQKQQKQLKASLAALRRGDRIVTGGGIVGVVQRTKKDSDEIEIEIAPQVKITVIRATIATVLSSSAKPANDQK